MTEREAELISDLETAEQTQKSIEKSICSKQKKLKDCKQKIISLELAIKEEQLNSIRASIDKSGLDFNAFRKALESGQLKSLMPMEKIKLADEKSVEVKGNDDL